MTVAELGTGLSVELEAHTTEWHCHDQHQVLYARTGVIHFEIEGAQWTLPPLRAALVGAGVRHRTRSSAPVSLRAVFLASPLIASDLVDEGCQVFAVTPLARELISYLAALGEGGTRALRQSLLTAMGELLREWGEHRIPLRLPIASSPEIQRATAYAHEDLGAATVEGASAAAILSERSLARRFRSELGMSWREYLRTARLVRALELLAEPGTSVTEAGFAVGFDSHAAFSRSFRELCQESPSDYQRRLRRSGADGGK